MIGAASWTRGTGASTNGPIIASSGCMTIQNGGNTQTQPHTVQGAGDLALYVDASKSSSLFGASTTVHPESMRVQCLIRYDA